MIKLTSIDGNITYLNSLYVETISKHSEVDTIIRLRGGKSLVVTELPEEIVKSIEDNYLTKSICWSLPKILVED
jgi:uncharacterized protein YlzI (FlbEa/FlbD family)